MSHTAALAMNWEVLWLIDRWAAEIPAHLARQARRRHFTAIALEEMRSRQTFLTGLKRLFTEGSVASQLKRPFAYLFHVVRRNIRPPYWQGSSNQSCV